MYNTHRAVIFAIARYLVLLIVLIVCCVCVVCFFFILFFTAGCYAERGYATTVCHLSHLSVRPSV